MTANKLQIYLVITGLVILSACNNDPKPGDGTKPIPELSEEYFTGGVLGTDFEYNRSAFAYEQPTQSVIDGGFESDFLYGEDLFEGEFSTNLTGLRSGLGPVAVRSSCLACHPNYGHGKRMERYRANDTGNGYLLVVTDVNEGYIPTLTGMPQTMAVAPFLPPLDESGINIEWRQHIDQFGNTFPDGETYSLIYPEVTIEEWAFNVTIPDNIMRRESDNKILARLEATIGIYGTGLIDAIPEDSILAQYYYAKSKGAILNDSKYIVDHPDGKDADLDFPIGDDGKRHIGRYTYGLTRSTLQNGPGSNAIWNITNVTRPGRQYHYITADYATKMSEHPDVQQALLEGRLKWEGVTAETIKDSIYNYLTSTNLPVELSEKEYIQFMVWHRGLSVPAARDLDNPQVQRGRQLFRDMGCATCHRPSWTTGADDFSGDPKLNNKLPRYPNQKIWPYSDFLQHRLEMKNDIRTGWCRTTPLWGRGLSGEVTGANEHLHDMRARNYIEAIMWHGGDAAEHREKFYNLPKEDRDAVVKFLEAI